MRNSKYLNYSQHRSVNNNLICELCETMKRYGIAKLKDIELVHCILHKENFKKLKKVKDNLYANQITSKGAIVLFDTLKICNSTLLNLNLSRNELDDDCIENLTNFLQDNMHLKTLSLSSNNITDKGIELLSACLI